MTENFYINRSYRSSLPFDTINWTSHQVTLILIIRYLFLYQGNSNHDSGTNLKRNCLILINTKSKSFVSKAHIISQNQCKNKLMTNKEYKLLSKINKLPHFSNHIQESIDKHI